MSKPIAAYVADNKITVWFSDRTSINNPLDWHPWLKRATPDQLKNIQLLSHSIYWPDLDNGLDIEGMIRNIHSHER